MWVIIAVAVGLVTGPHIRVVTDAGLFKTEKTCEVALEKGVKTDLKGKDKEEFEDGYQKFTCIRVLRSDEIPK